MNEALVPEGGKVLCAVSGGADSVYLLCRLKELAEAGRCTVEAAHFNHCLRGAESERDEAFVRELCGKLGIEAHFGRGDVAAFAVQMGLGTEDAARRLRYAFLEETAGRTDAGSSALWLLNKPSEGAETIRTFTPSARSRAAPSTRVDTSEPEATRTTSGWASSLRM